MGKYKITAERASEEDIQNYKKSKLDSFREFVEDGIKYTVSGDISVVDSVNNNFPASFMDARIGSVIKYVKKIMDEKIELAVGKLEITIDEDVNLLSERANNIDKYFKFIV